MRRCDPAPEVAARTFGWRVVTVGEMWVVANAAQRTFGQDEAPDHGGTTGGFVSASRLPLAAG